MKQANKQRGRPASQRTEKKKNFENWRRPGDGLATSWWRPGGRRADDGRGSEIGLALRPAPVL